MASLICEPGGRKTIQFTAGDGRRPKIRLGRCDKRSAQAVKLRVEQLVSAQIRGHVPPDDTCHWLAAIDDDLGAKLAAAGLVSERSRATLGEFTAAYIASRTDLKELSRQHLERTARLLKEHFSADRPLRLVTPGEADGFRLWLKETMADNTVRRLCSRAKQFFRAAKRRKLIDDNPFADMKGLTVRANRERDYLVTREQSDRVIEACPDCEWRLLFVLSRYAGLRCPSEHLSLRWADIDWERGRMTVRSPKTKHCKTGGIRTLPIFPEVLTHLQAQWDAAPEGAEFVIARYRTHRTNLRTQFMRIIERAGMTPWPKVFQNLRLTRETELCGQFPLHVVCEWLGNTPSVAREHYLRVTEADFAKAAGKGVDPSAGANSDDAVPTDADRFAPGGAKSGATDCGKREQTTATIPPGHSTDASFAVVCDGGPPIDNLASYPARTRT